MTQRTTNGDSPITFTYDNNGNLSSDGLGRSFTWNGQDQLKSLTVGGVSTSFLYDPLGRRSSLTQGSTLKTYFYDDLDMLADGTNKYLNSASLDEPLQLDTGSNTHSYLADHLGSVTRLTNATGASTGQYVYAPYGSQLSSSSPLAGNPFTYTARENDATGLLYYRARYYDPSLELFISQDPLGDAQRYVGGNPIRFVDPMGLWQGQPAMYDPGTQGLPYWRSHEYDAAPDVTAEEIVPFIVPEIRIFKPAGFLCKITESLQSKGAANWTFGVSKSTEKWTSQMKQRGWTADQITEAISKGKPYPAVNNINPGNAATRYVHPKTGQYVVRDNVTKQILQIGGPGFVPPGL